MELRRPALPEFTCGELASICDDDDDDYDQPAFIVLVCVCLCNQIFGSLSKIAN